MKKIYKKAERAERQKMGKWSFGNGVKRKWSKWSKYELHEL